MNIIESNAIKVEGTGLAQTDSNQSIPKPERIWIYLTTILSGIIIVLLILFYLVLSAKSQTEKSYQKELRLQQMQNSLSTALIDVNFKNYELSRQTANDFFNSLESELELKEDSAFTVNQRQVMLTLLVKKGVINKLLAEKNPEANKELAGVFETYQTNIKGFQPMQK